MSDMTRSTGVPASAASNCPNTSSSVKSPWMNSTPAIVSMGRISEAITRPEWPTSATATWDQPPGALPRSSTVMPGRISLSRSCSSSSL